MDDGWEDDWGEFSLADDDRREEELRCQVNRNKCDGKKRAARKQENVVESARRSKNFTRNRRLRLKYHFGLSLDDYDAMLKKQDGCCGICGEHYSAFDINLAVDHDHRTGQVRGLLCSHCNLLLGYWEKMLETNFKAKAKAYLSRCQ